MMPDASDSKIEIAVHSPADLVEGNYAPRWIDTLESLGARVRICDFRAPDIIDQVRGVDGAMWHYYHSERDRHAAPMILNAMATGLGIPIFPNLATRWHFDEKVAQHYLFESIGAPAIKTWIFWDHESASRFIETCSYPIIFKLSVGAGASNVLKIDSKQQARVLVMRMFHRGMEPGTLNEFARSKLPRSGLEFREGLRRGVDAVRYFLSGELPPVRQQHIQKHYIYFQEYLPGNPCDIRVTVVGDRAFGYRRQNRPGDFRASGSGIIDWDEQQIPEKAVKIAHGISRDCGFQSMAYDFLYDSAGELRLGEVSYAFVNHLVAKCPGHWDRDLIWRPGSMWPESAQAEDFVREVREKPGA